MRGEPRAIAFALPLAAALYVALLALSGPAAALDPLSTDARAIMRAVFERPAAERSLSRLKMTIRDQTGTRERLLELRIAHAKDVTKALIVLAEPADVRDTAFLSVDHRSGDKANAQWLYLPKLHRVTRIPGSGRADAFLGSDFSYADLSEPNPDDYDFKLIDGAAKSDGEACWLIESTPRSAKVRAETGYLKTQLWVSKSRLLTLQVKAWVIKDHKIKYLKYGDVRKVDAFWTPHRVQAKTVVGSTAESETTMQVLSVRVGASEVSDSDFDEHRLERGL
jgi:hypothetical protein